MPITTSNTESVVLSSCLNRLDQGWYGHVCRIGGNSASELFSDRRNRAVFDAIGAATASGRLATTASVIDKLKGSGEVPDPEEYVFQLQTIPSLPTPQHLDDALAELLSSRSIRRQVKSMEQVLSDIDDPDVEPTPEDVAVRLREIIENTDITSNIETFGEITKRILASPRPMWAQSTGIEGLDEVLGGQGLESGCLIVVAARPKVGKTILMNTLIHNTLDGGAIPLVLNYETKDIEFTSKMIARYIADPSLHWGLIKRYLSDDEDLILTATQRQEILDGIAWAEEQPWYVSFDKSMSMHDIQALVTKVKAENPDDSKIVLFVDYLQLQVTDSFHEYEEISQLTKFYKRIAGEFDISCCVLSQLNRDAKGGIPSVHQLRGSGSIEQDADTILLMDRPNRRDENQPKHVLEIFAGTTRLAEGDSFELFIDGGTNIVTDMPEDMKADRHDALMEDIPLGG